MNFAAKNKANLSASGWKYEIRNLLCSYALLRLCSGHALNLCSFKIEDDFEYKLFENKIIRGNIDPGRILVLDNNLIYRLNTRRLQLIGSFDEWVGARVAKGNGL